MSPHRCHNRAIARRRRPSLRFQLAILATGLIALVVIGFLGESGDDGPEVPAVGPTVTTGAPGFPPAAEGSICRTLLTAEDAEALVGRPLAAPVIEPLQGNCAWPLEAGNPRGAELFLIAEPSPPEGLEENLARAFAGIDHRLEPVAELGEEAYFVFRRPNPDGTGGDEFLEGIYVDTGEVTIRLANGGRDIWRDAGETVQQRLRLAMSLVLERLASES